MHPRTPHTPTRSRHHGFTLMETALATVLIGVGVTALMELLGAGTMANAAANEVTVGIQLANNVHELTLPLTFDQVLALDGATYSSAVDARGQAIAGMETWSQSIAARRVNPDNLTSTTGVGGSDVARATATAKHNGKVVQAVSWLVVDPQ